MEVSISSSFTFSIWEVGLHRMPSSSCLARDSATIWMASAHSSLQDTTTGWTTSGRRSAGGQLWLQLSAQQKSSEKLKGLFLELKDRDKLLALKHWATVQPGQMKKLKSFQFVPAASTTAGAELRPGLSHWGQKQN